MGVRTLTAAIWYVTATLQASNETVLLYGGLIKGEPSSELWYFEPNSADMVRLPAFLPSHVHARRTDAHARTCPRMQVHALCWGL